MSKSSDEGCGCLIVILMLILFLTGRITIQCGSSNEKTQHKPDSVWIEEIKHVKSDNSSRF